MPALRRTRTKTPEHGLTRLYTALHGSTRLYTASHNFSRLRRIFISPVLPGSLATAKIASSSGSAALRMILKCRGAPTGFFTAAYESSGRFHLSIGPPRAT